MIFWNIKKQIFLYFKIKNRQKSFIYIYLKHKIIVNFLISIYIHNFDYKLYLNRVLFKQDISYLNFKIF